MVNCSVSCINDAICFNFQNNPRLYINKTSILYLECSSRSFAKTCSLTLLALLESFLSIAEHISPVTKKTNLHIYIFAGFFKICNAHEKVN